MDAQGALRTRKPSVRLYPFAKLTRWYSSSNCTVNDADSRSWTFTYPGDDFGGQDTGDVWNDQIYSFMCERIC